MTHKHCLLCNSALLNDLHGYENAYLVKCKDCDFVFSSRIPTPEELKDHYTNYPYFVSLSPITKKRYLELLKRFEPFRQTGNLLDMGCGSGLFLECAKEMGWKVYGTEFSDELIEKGQAKGIKMFKAGSLPDELFKIEFDVITSFEVIEHVNAPHDEIQMVTKLLRQGGAFYITTPNFNSASRRILKSKWNAIEYPEHLSYYTASTLNKLLEKHGLEREFVTTTGFSVSRFRESQAATNNSTNPKQEGDEKLRTTVEYNPFLRFTKYALNAALNLLKAGDALKALYVRR